MTERELKLIADSSAVVPDLQDVAPGVTTGPSVHKAMTSVYYDTATLSLARGGVTLRWRDEGNGPVWTLKLPGTATRSTLSRREINVVGPARLVPKEAADLVRVFRRGEDMNAVATLHTDRTETPVLIDAPRRIDVNQA